jgi:hypothetical protein
MSRYAAVHQDSSTIPISTSLTLLCRILSIAMIVALPPVATFEVRFEHSAYPMYFVTILL